MHSATGFMSNEWRVNLVTWSSGSSNLVPHWVFFFVNMYEVGSHLMKIAVETVTSGMPKHVCLKIIH